MTDNLDQYRDLFFSEADDLMNHYTQLLVEFEEHPESKARLQELFRIAHTLKGMSATMGFQPVAEFVHEWEFLFDGLRQDRLTVHPEMISVLLAGADALTKGLERLKARETIPEGSFTALIERLKGSHLAPTVPTVLTPPLSPAHPTPTVPSSTPSTLRVDVHLLDDLLNLVGELVIVKTRLQQLAPTLRNETLERTVHQAHRIVTQLQDKVLDTRVVPARETLNRFPRLVRDLAMNQHKDVDLVIEGGDIGVDRAVLDGLVEPLTHMVNNAVTHGIETGEARTAKGKPPKGRLTLSVRREQNAVTVEVRDDGSGMDVDRLKHKAVSMGILTAQESSQLTDPEALMLITLPGFSTAESVTTAAGRGVGMDVVREKIQKMQGTLTIESVKGQGSAIRLHVPFTLTILRTLLARVGSLTVCIPFLSVKELLPTPSLNHEGTVKVGEDDLTVTPLTKLLHLTSTATGPAPLVILRTDNRLLTVAVDQLLTQQDVVVKPLPAPLDGLAPYAGATILGDGTVALILDLHELFLLIQRDGLRAAA